MKLKYEKIKLEKLKIRKCLNINIFRLVCANIPIASEYKSTYVFILNLGDMDVGEASQKVGMENVENVEQS